MSKIVTVVREYDDNEKLISETETTRVTKQPENQRARFGFGMIPMEVRAEEGAPGE